MGRVKGGDDANEVKLIRDRLPAEEDVIPRLSNSGPTEKEEVYGLTGDRRPGGWG